MEKYQTTKWNRLILRVGQVGVGIVVLLNVYEAGKNIGRFWRTHDIRYLFFVIIEIGFLIIVLYFLWNQFQKHKRWKASLESDKEKE